MKAIETVYKGYKFRSRLEARWAVFFDALNIKWEYEKEGFDLDGLWYLPDFWLPELKYWIEIKGEEPSDEENLKCKRLVKAIYNPQEEWYARKQVFMLIGTIPLPPGEMPISLHYSYDKEDDLVSIHREHAWCECPRCRSIHLTPKGVYFFLPCSCGWVKFNEDVEIVKAMNALVDFQPDKDLYEWWVKSIRQFVRSADTPRLIAAYTAARQARF